MLSEGSIFYYTNLQNTANTQTKAQYGKPNLPKIKNFEIYLRGITFSIFNFWQIWPTIKHSGGWVLRIMISIYGLCRRNLKNKVHSVDNLVKGHIVHFYVVIACARFFGWKNCVILEEFLCRVCNTKTGTGLDFRHSPSKKAI